MRVSSLLLLISASLLFATGGLAMKFSDGLTKMPASAAVFVLFCVGAACQAIAMKRAEMGLAYIFVLGCEAIAAYVLSIAVLGERATGTKLAALALIVSGIALLER